MSKACCDTDNTTSTGRHQFKIGLLGNPNCGKTTLFNQLTGTRQRIGNWPGVTVDRKYGEFQFCKHPFEVVDLPGVYSLDNSARSLDERITRDYILSGEADVIINIVDAGNLERNLYLSVQCLEMQVPMVIAVNMLDMAEKHDIRIDFDALASAFGCPVVPIIATRKQGLDRLLEAVQEVAKNQRIPSQRLVYSQDIETAIDTILARVPEDRHCSHINCRWLAAQLLDGDSGVESLKSIDAEIIQFAHGLKQQIEQDQQEDMDILLADGRYGFARELVVRAVKKPEHRKNTLSDKIDRIALHPLLGIPVFLLMIYLMFLFTINIGGALVDFFDMAGAAIFVDGFGRLLLWLGSPEWLKTLLADGIGGGVQVVATFIPIIGFLFLFLSFMEGSGYMMRAAFVVDRFMRRLGLPGKAFVPLIVGFGCNVPAIAATRTLDNHRERILTVLMAPFMSCGARLSVYALFAAAFFPTGGQNMVFSLYLIGIAVAVLTALAVRTTLLPGEASAFLMELPSYHLPSLKSILLGTWSRLRGFVTDAGKIIVFMVIIINFLNSWGTDGSFGNQNSEKSVLSAISKTLTPAFAPLGIRDDNWPATVGIFTGVLAKEVVVGTLDAVYSGIDSAASTQQQAQQTIPEQLMAAVESIPANLSEAMNNLADPLGLGVLDSSDEQNLAAQEQGIHTATFGAMAKRFDGQVGAYAYLLFILLYAPCVAATAAIYRETGRNWMLFALGWSTGLAFSLSTLFYQLARFQQHPISSSLWIIGVITALLFTLLAMRRSGQQHHAMVMQP